MQNIEGNLCFDRRPQIQSYASAAGKKEGEGPLSEWFDSIISDSYAGQKTFEQAESELLRRAVAAALEKGGFTPGEIDLAFCGDLLNQCVASSFGMRGLGIPYAGVYSACSTMALSMILSAVAVESGAARRGVCAASSHFCTAERQYRFPLEYGSQRPPTSQWTVTGAGACVVGRPAESRQKPETKRIAEHQKTFGIHIHSARVGRIVDYNITDQNNMGAAMAPAVVKTGTIFFAAQRKESADRSVILNAFSDCYM